MKPFQADPPKRLTEPTLVKSFRTVIDYSAIFDEFYEAISTVRVPEGELSFQELLVQIQPIDLIKMATDAIAKTIMAGSNVSGISYTDIAALHRHPSVRESLYIYRLHDRFNEIYHPTISATEQYHLDSLEGAMTDVIVEYFGDAVRTAVKGEDDVILWRGLMACILESAKSIALSGPDMGIREMALMNFTVTDIHPYGQDTMSFILELTGPS